MFVLLEIVIGFAAIMLMLSLLVKSLTSLIKNHFDYYAPIVELELKRLESFWASSGKKFTKSINPKTIGSDFFDQKNVLALLSVEDGETDKKKDSEASKKKEFPVLIEESRKNIDALFSKRSKNLALVVGLALCLGANINALSIWDRLYRDGDLRSKLNAQPFLENLEAEYKKRFPEETTNGGAGQPSGSAAQQNPGAEAGQGAAQPPSVPAPQEELQAFMRDFGLATADIGFGVGALWRAKTENLNLVMLLYEFFGSLLTGVLISIGAPYWHDALRTLVSLRRLAVQKKANQ